MSGSSFSKWTLASALVLIVAFGFELRWRAANHPYISQWDEAFHALVAKNLTAHPLEPTLYDEKVLPSDDHDWTRARVWLHKPPLPLWLMSAGIAAFGENELSFRIPSIILDTSAILLIYLLALELFGPASQLAGLFASALYAVNPLMIRLVSGRIPDDTPHVVNVFFITLTVLLFVASARRNSRALAAAAGLSLGLGTMCMTAVALLGLAAPLPFILAMRGVRGSVRLLAVAFAAFVAVALPWPLYCLSRWPELWRFESSLQTSHLFTVIDTHGHPWWWYLKVLPQQYGGSALFVRVAACAVLAYSIREALRRKDAGLAATLCWVILPYAFFSIIATKMYSYVCVAVPAICLLAGLAAAALWAARSGRFGAVALTGLLAAGVQFARVAAERGQADYSICPWSDRYDYPSFRRAMLGLRAVPGPKVILNVGDSKTPQAMYYSGAAAYSDEPSPGLVKEVLSRGFRVYVLLEERSAAKAFPGLKAGGLDKRIVLIPLPSPYTGDLKHPYES